jgi:FKBP-type peptidyl-prolyl cis-trans isomerase 2
VLIACSGPATDGQETELAAMGDTVTVKYTGTFPNGTVFDTNIEAVAERNNISKQSFDPLEVKLGQGDVVPGFENALVGMEAGETKTVTIPPEKAYGKVRDGRILSVDINTTVNRTNEYERFVDLPLDRLEQLPGGKSVGSVVEVGDISYEIVNKTNRTARLELNVEVGDTINLPRTSWNSTVVEVRDETYLVRQDPANGTVVQTQLGPAVVTVRDDTILRSLAVKEGQQIRTQQRTGYVKEIDGNEATIDFNSPLAGETLIFEIEVVDVR